MTILVRRLGVALHCPVAATAAAGTTRRSSSATAAPAATGPSTRSSVYRLAAEMGADFIEPDLVATKDGVLIARHENEIGGTTDVAMKFPRPQADQDASTAWPSPAGSPRTSRSPKSRRCAPRERLPFARTPTTASSRCRPSTKSSSWRSSSAASCGRPIGVYPETKHPTYFRSIGLPLEDRLLTALAPPRMERRDRAGVHPVLRGRTCATSGRRRTLRLIQLLEGSDPDRRRAARHQRPTPTASGRIPARDARRGRTARCSRRPIWSQRAHRAGLLVHVWTLRQRARVPVAELQGRLRRRVPPVPRSRRRWNLHRLPGCRRSRASSPLNSINHRDHRASILNQVFSEAPVVFLRTSRNRSSAHRQGSLEFSFPFCNPTILQSCNERFSSFER